MTYLYMAAYVAAVVIANVVVSVFGPTASVYTAFALIGVVITVRDRLHEEWKGRVFWPMSALIAVTTAASYAVQAEAGRIALASAAAFAISEAVDAVAYHALGERRWLVKSNGSNVLSAAVDSFVFPLLAFGGFLPWIVAGQFAAKVGGGALWSLVLKPKRVAAVALVVALAAPQTAHAQSASIGVGQFANNFVRQDVVESVLRSPSFKGWTPSAILAWDLDGDNAKPTVIAQVGRTLVASYPVIIGADAGATFLPFMDYEDPEPHASVTALAFITPRLKVVGIYSVQPWNDWARSVVLKLDLTVLGR